MWIICLNVSHAQACRPSPICTFAENLEHKKWGCVIMMSDAVHWFFDLTVLGLECDALDSMAASRTKLKVGVVLCATGPIIFSISHSSKNSERPCSFSSEGRVLCLPFPYESHHRPEKVHGATSTEILLDDLCHPEPTKCCSLAWMAVQNFLNLLLPSIAATGRSITVHFSSWRLHSMDIKVLLHSDLCCHWHGIRMFNGPISLSCMSPLICFLVMSNLSVTGVVPKSTPSSQGHKGESLLNGK